jgi:hypothetical protein
MYQRPGENVSVNLCVCRASSHVVYLSFSVCVLVLIVVSSLSSPSSCVLSLHPSIPLPVACHSAPLFLLRYRFEKPFQTLVVQHSEYG